MRTAIVTDSNSGITQAEAQKMNVFVLPMPVIIEGQAYYEGIDLLPDQFFRALTERQAVSTSQPSPGDVTALWDKVLAEYEELVYIPMSSGLSASCATAQMLAEDYEGRVFVVDNHRISISQKSSAWDAVAGSYQDAAALEDWREMAVNAFPEHGGIFADPLSFSVSSHVGPDAFGMAVSRRLARTKDGI